MGQGALASVARSAGRLPCHLGALPVAETWAPTGCCAPVLEAVGGTGQGPF